MLSKIKNLFYNPYKFVKKHKNIKVDPKAILLKQCKFQICDQNIVNIGQNSMINCNFIFESDQGKIEIGDNTFINQSTKLISRSSIKIGNYVSIAWGCTIYDHNSHSLNFLDRQKDIKNQLGAYRNNKNFISNKNWNTVKSKPIIIEDNAWIGFGCIILQGVRIGEGSIVGAGSVVRNDVDPWSVVAGNPAVKIKDLER